MDVPWTYADLTQLTGHSVRMGQKSFTYVELLIITQTFEISILALVQAERSAQRCAAGSPF